MREVTKKGKKGSRARTVPTVDGHLIERSKVSKFCCAVAQKYA